jgi:hypothetical protein
LHFFRFHPPSVHDAAARPSLSPEADARQPKLRDLNYRVQTVNDPAAFQSCVLSEKPFLAIVDLAG